MDKVLLPGTRETFNILLGPSFVHEAVMGMPYSR